MRSAFIVLTLCAMLAAGIVVVYSLRPAEIQTAMVGAPLSAKPFGYRDLCGSVRGDML